MNFDSFSIRRASDNSSVNIDKVDMMICEKFHFKFKDKDYGHFYFTETEEELGAFQKSISWVGLVHTIVFYSNINYGKSSSYDIEAAMTWIKEYAIDFPHSAVVFTSELVEFLRQEVMYIFVNLRRYTKQ